MPRGIPNNKPATVITVDHRSGILGRMERLRDQKAFEAQSLAVAIRILDEEDRHNALMAMDGKLTKALAHSRERKGLPPAPKAGKTEKPKPPIHGQRLSLFILEHCSDGHLSRTEAAEKLAAAGSPITDLRTLGGSFGALMKMGHVKANTNGAIKLSAGGAKYAQDLRAKLESKRLIADNYRLPVAS